MDSPKRQALLDVRKGSGKWEGDTIYPTIERKGWGTGETEQAQLGVEGIKRAAFDVCAKLFPMPFCTNADNSL